MFVLEDKYRPCGSTLFTPGTLQSQSGRLRGSDVAELLRMVFVYGALYGEVEMLALDYSEIHASLSQARLQWDMSFLSCACVVAGLTSSNMCLAMAVP